MRNNNNKSPSKNWRELQSEEDSIDNLTLSYSNTKILSNDKNNTSIASLKDSIQKDLRSYKKITKKNNESIMKSSMNLCNNYNGNQKPSEKDKLNNYFQSIKRTLTSSTTCNNINTNTQSKIEQNNYNSNTNSGNQNFIIFEAFKNMMNKGSRETKRETHYDNNNNRCINNMIFHPAQNELMTDNEQLSIINDLQSIKIEESNPIQAKDSGNINTFALTSETNFDKTNKYNKKKIDEAYYKKKYFQLKTQLKSLRLRLAKEKNISEMLTLKLFYETHKTDPQAMTQGKITQMLTDKIKDNLVIFDRLEEEIDEKDKLIEERNELILHQKDIIAKLMKQINHESVNDKE